ncbi:MAG: leucine--tRNA ligase [Candidatus Methanomethylophilaceae archaeon]|nr:leucine--tRNA ligase [Candidatus Methanomethylophilaceae archaeon]
MPDYESIERKWQVRWSDRKLNESERDERPKFMIIFAYPGVTGYLHVGHMRGYTYADAIGRYKRMTGYNVLFPVGTHATGNGAISLAARIAAGDKDIMDYMVRNGCPPEKLEGELRDPLNVVWFFNGVYQEEYWKRFGFLADWRRFTCTLYPDYSKFMQWQFRKLNEAGLLIQKPYFAPACLSCGPVAVDPSETDLSKGGNAETQEFTLLKFRSGDEILVAATLRPETVYGQVCFWVNPEVEYLKVRNGGETWIVSPQAYEKLSHQKDGLESIGAVKGSDLLGRTCIAPMIHREIPVLPAAFCDPDVGTGMVTSVPSDAPDDWMSLTKLKEDHSYMERYGIAKETIDAVVPISIISMKGYGDFPAQDIVERMGIEEADDPRLEEAKKQVYKDGYHLGVMKDICGEFAGMRVEEAKERMKQAMIDSGEADVFFDLSEEVVCRCGCKVVIKRIDDQWFIDYGNEDLTQRTSDHCRTMTINPVEYHNNVHAVLKWFRERACVRLGNWLGTKFPFDERWIIEAISDSTLYPVYYLISMYANDGRIEPEQMTEAFFDYAILGKGDAEKVSGECGIDTSLLDEIRAEVLYWYPLDMNLGGKEHMTVHFPAFLKNHVAILPPEMWPKGITVNWYITGKKSKISKSKGGAQPIPGAAKKFGADGMRLYYAHVASPFADVEWDEDNVMSYSQRIDRIASFIGDLSSYRGSATEMDAWLVSRMNTHVSTIRSAMERYDLRQMATVAYFEIFNDLKWYQRRGGENPEAISECLRTWITAMMPVTPHMAEEMWEAAGFDGLVSEAQLPEAGERSVPAEYGEDLIREVMSDAQQIIKVTGIEPKRMVLYTAPSWKIGILGKALELQEKGELSIPSLTKACMSDPDIKVHGKAASDMARKTAEDMMRLPAGSMRPMFESDERAHLAAAAGFLSKEMGLEAEVYSSDEEGRYDPGDKARMAVPGRPAIYLE